MFLTSRRKDEDVWEVEVKMHAFLTYTSNESECLASRCCCLTPAERNCSTNCRGHEMGHEVFWVWSPPKFQWGKESCMPQDRHGADY